jgi:16S rRNA (adenine1518-N6/adenine1519-N6)-dimethyltransferase
MGQNFLVSDEIPGKIADSALLDNESGVLEIGPGIGCLTRELSRRAGKTVAIELDSGLKGILSEALEDCENAEVMFTDIMKTDLNALISERFDGLRPCVCANLPYNITTPVITKLLEADLFDTVTVMIQKEVAERICAKAGTPEYGAFTLFIQWHCTVEKLFDVGRECFMPRPKVTSSVIRLKKRQERPCTVKDEAKMFKIIRASFNMRRKTLVNGLKSIYPGRSKEELAQVLSLCGLDENIRGETLTIEEFAAVSDRL